MQNIWNPSTAIRVPSHGHILSVKFFHLVQKKKGQKAQRFILNRRAGKYFVGVLCLFVVCFLFFYLHQKSYFFSGFQPSPF